MNLEGKINLIKESVTAIKQAIIGKNVTPSGNVSTYANAINNIVTPNNQTKTVTSNGVVRYDTGYTGLEQVTVNVNQETQELSVTDNGTYQPTSGYIGFRRVRVNVEPDLTTKTITTNGTYNASSDNVDGYSSVTVNVQDEKNMNYWEGTNGYCGNFYILYDIQGHYALDIGATTIRYKLESMASAPVKIANFNALEQIEVDECCKEMFKNNSTIISANFKNLQSIEYNGIFYEMFRGCTSLQVINFPSLNSNSFGSNTSQFRYMLATVNGCTVHFPSNLQSVIGSWTDVQHGFGGTNTTVLFDLPVTS